MTEYNQNKILCLEKEMTLLFLDNDKKSYDKYLNFFNSKFLKIFHVKSIYDASILIMKEKIDIVIFDIDFEDGNGFEFIKNSKKRFDFISILLTATFSNEHTYKKNNFEIDEYILKPIEEYLLDEILEQTIDKYKKNINKDEELYLIKQYNDLLTKNGIFSKTDKTGKITYVNDFFCNTSGYPKEELIGKKHSILRHPDNPSELYTNLWQTIKYKKQEWNGVFKNLSKKGKAYYQRTTIKPIFDKNGKIVEYIAIRNSVNNSITTKEQLASKIDTLDLAVLVLIQIEDFNILDKFYNIPIVSKIEKVFGYELLYYLPNEFVFDNVYNLGDGKYALLANFYDFEKNVEDVDNYFRKFVRNVKNSNLVIDDIEYDLNIVLSYSLGKYMLYDDAKYGLAKAIEKKKKIEYSNDFSIYEYKEARKNMETISMVKIALDNYNIVSYFQPIINNKTREIEKYESLVRLINEEGKILSPYHFLNASKQGVYYNKITERVLRNSFKMLKYIATKISINISSLDIENEELRLMIYKLLEKNEEHAHNVIFELLEDESVKDFKVIETFITNVKAKGVKIAIDDFGAGYSNFERLLKFQPDILKIDGSLIKDIVKDKYSRNVVETIVMFAKKQNIQTIAEYVESEDIFNVLNEIGIDYSQGYYFGRPQSHKDIQLE